MSASMENIVLYSELWSCWWVGSVTVLTDGQSPTVASYYFLFLPNGGTSVWSIIFLAKERENNSLFAPRQPLVFLASFVALVVLQRLLSHQIPEQHAEHCVRSQTQKDRTHAFVQAQHAFGLAHLQHTVRKPVVETALEERKGCF